jgi:ABC-2 type transport system permease protein
MGKLARLFWEFFRRDLKITLSYRFQFFFQAAGLLSICVTFFFVSLMLRRVEGGIAALSKYGGSYFAFAIVGIAVSSYIDLSLRTFASAIRTAQMTGTFEAMLTTRTPIGALVAGSSVYTLAYSAVRSLLLVAFGALLFGIDLHLDSWPALVVVFSLTVLSTMALGIFAAGFIVLFKQGDPLTSAMSGLSWLLSGVLYPKEILPGWVQRVADILPLTHALEAMRLALLQGRDLGALSRSVVGLAIFAAAGIPLSLAWFAWSVGRARAAGSLARY